MRKYYWWIYFGGAIIFSLYIHINAPGFASFLIISLITFALFVGIYFCLKNIQLSKIFLRIVRGICIIMLSFLIYGSFVLGSLHGLNISGPCLGLVTKNIFTGNIKIYPCNSPPWYTTIVSGEEARKILLDKMQPVVSPTPTPNTETANWKMYRNDKHGFEVKYPTDWHVNENSTLGGGIREKDEFQFAFTSPDFSLETGLAFIFSVKPTPFQNNQEFLLWRKSVDEGNPNTKGKWVTKEIDFFNVGRAVEQDTQDLKTIYIVKIPYLYQFSDYRTNPAFSKIMSTFKFTR